MINPTVTVFVRSEVVGVQMPVQGRAVDRFAHDGFGMRGIHSITNEGTANLLCEGEGKDNLW